MAEGAPVREYPIEQIRVGRMGAIRGQVGRMACVFGHVWGRNVILHSTTVVGILRVAPRNSRLDKKMLMLLDSIG